jgi:hypothetical protein
MYEKLLLNFPLQPVLSLMAPSDIAIAPPAVPAYIASLVGVSPPSSPICSLLQRLQQNAGGSIVHVATQLPARFIYPFQEQPRE